jgi:predicted DNA-binding transcriptional regulator AlpA
VKSLVLTPGDKLGLSRVEAAEYVGVSTGLFDEMVKDGRMPKPKAINARRVWSRPQLEKAFASLPEDGQDVESQGEDNPWANASVV